MLADTAPWYLPALVLSLMGWMAAPSLSPRLQARPVFYRVYLALPPLLVAGLLLFRSIAVMNLESGHNEVALALDSNSSFSERVQLLFTGYGALEGALLSLLLFALFAPSLPSLRDVSVETQAFVRSRMMVHNGAWALLSLLLLFPSEAHSVLGQLPSSPTVSLEAWTRLMAVVLFTFLILMSGELLTASSHMALNNEASVLFRRAVVKTSLALILAWWLMVQSDAFSQVWWTRPQQETLPHVGLLVAVYATIVLMYHAPATTTEGRFHHHSHQSRTLTVSLVVQFVVVLMTTWKVTSLVDVYGDGMVAFSTAWRMTASVLLFAGALMFLPSLGYDAAHRPESWWARVAFLLVLTGGSILSESVWLLAPGLLLAASLQLHLPWLVERSTEPRWPRCAGLAWWAVAAVTMVLVTDVQHMLWFSVLIMAGAALLERWLSRTLDHG